jgi:hypothetical protein
MMLLLMTTETLGAESSGNEGAWLPSFVDLRVDGMLSYLAIIMDSRGNANPTFAGSLYALVAPNFPPSATVFFWWFEDIPTVVFNVLLTAHHNDVIT